MVLEAASSSSNCWHYLGSKNSLGCRVEGWGQGRGQEPFSTAPSTLLLGLETGEPSFWLTVCSGMILHGFILSTFGLEERGCPRDSDLGLRAFSHPPGPPHWHRVGACFFKDRYVGSDSYSFSKIQGYKGIHRGKKKSVSPFPTRKPPIPLCGGDSSYELLTTFQRRSLHQ